MAAKDRYVTFSYVHRSGRLVPNVGVARDVDHPAELGEWVKAAWVTERTTSDSEAVGLVVAYLIGLAPEFVRRVK